MTKSQLISKVAVENKVSYKTANNLINTFLTAIVESIDKGENVSLANFGTFRSSRREERQMKIPKLNEYVKVSATNMVKFKAGKGFKDSINKKD